MLKGFVLDEEKDIVRIPMKTRNLMPVTSFTGKSNSVMESFNSESANIVFEPNTQYTISLDFSANIQTGVFKVTFYYADESSTSSAWMFGTGKRTLISDSGKTIAALKITDYAQYIDVELKNIILNSGSTPLPYEPYGYQEGWEVRDNQDRIMWGREDEFHTTTGTLPFKGYGLPVKVKSLLGNTFQNGIPTPETPVMPEFVGVRDENIVDIQDKFDVRWALPDTEMLTQLNNLPSGSYTFSAEFILTERDDVSDESDRGITFVNSSGSIRCMTSWGSAQVGTIVKDEYTFTITPSSAGNFTAAYFYGCGNNTNGTTGYATIKNIRIDTGYRIPITNAGQTTTVYLSEVPTVRRIRKMRLLNPSITVQTETGYRLVFSISEHPALQYASGGGFCNIAEWQGDYDKIGFVASVTYAYITQNIAEWATVEGATAWLEENEVYIWYVLAEPEIRIVNEPLAKIKDYADELNDTVATLPEIPTTIGQNTLTVDTTLAPSKLDVSIHARKIHYGFKIDKSDSNSESAVIYTHDAVTMTPAYMDFTNDRFDYGSWGNAFFVRDCYPVALNLDGTEAYRLDPDDYTKKMDGTSSDILYELLTEEPSDWSTQWKQYYTKSGDEYELNFESTVPTFATNTYYKLTYNSSFTGNFMMAFPKVWFYRHEDSQYNYIEISNRKLSDDWKCYAHINTNGQEVDFIYLPLFKGVIKDSKLRSLPGQIPQGNTSAATEVDAATALGSRWQIWDHSSVECLNDLLTLMSKSINSQGRFGQGRSTGYDSTDTLTYGKLQTGTLVNKGKFHGYSDTTKEVKIFGIEGFWANRWDKLQGMLLVDNIWKVKMTTPYNFTGTDFITLSNAEVPSENGYLSTVQTSEYGSIPASTTDGSATKYFTDYFYKAATGTRVAIHGGACNNSRNAGFRCIYVNFSASTSDQLVGASPVYK